MREKNTIFMSSLVLHFFNQTCPTFCLDICVVSHDSTMKLLVLEYIDNHVLFVSALRGFVSIKIRS
jgi:hypothetical protein